MSRKKKFLPASQRSWYRDPDGVMRGHEIKMSHKEVGKRTVERRRLERPTRIYKQDQTP